MGDLIDPNTIDPNNIHFNTIKPPEINTSFIPMKIEPYPREHWRTVTDDIDFSEYIYVLSGVTFLLSSHINRSFHKMWTDDQGYVKIVAYTPNESYLLMYHGVMNCYFSDSDITDFEAVHNQVSALKKYYLQFDYDKLMSLIMEASL